MTCIKSTPGWGCLFLLAAAAVVVAAAVIAAAAVVVITVPATAEQDQQDDDPAPVTAKAIVAHKITSTGRFEGRGCRSFHGIPGG